MSANAGMEHITVEQLLDYADDRLAPEEASRVEAHLASCSACAAELDALQATVQRFSQDDWVLPPAAVRASAQEVFRRQYEPEAAAAPIQPSIADRLRALLAPRRQPALVLALVLIIVMVGLLYQLLQPPQLAEAATASSVSGITQLQEEAGGEWAALSEGATIENGDRLRTGADGSLLLTFSDGSTTRLRANTELLVGDLQVQPRLVMLQQESGETTSRILPATAPDARFEIRTPSARVMSPEGVVHVSHGAEGTLVRVEEGTATVSAQGSVLTAGAGQEIIVRIGQPPQFVGEEETPEPTATPSATPAPSETPTGTATPAPTETIAPPPPPVDEDDDDDKGDDLDDDGEDDDGSGAPSGDDDGDDDGGDDDGGQLDDDKGDDGDDDSGGDDSDNDDDGGDDENDDDSDADDDNGGDDDDGDEDEDNKGRDDDGDDDNGDDDGNDDSGGGDDDNGDDDDKDKD